MFSENIAVYFVLDTALADVDDNTDVQNNSKDYDNYDKDTLEGLRYEKHFSWSIFLKQAFYKEKTHTQSLQADLVNQLNKKIL